jgi:DNA polymerase-3 subunit beta
VRFGLVTLIARLIQGSPPNFKQLIPGEPPLTVRVLGPDLERAVRRMAAIARDGKGIVRLTWGSGMMRLSARSEEKGEVEATIPVETSGGPGRIALNISYLREYLSGKQGVVSMGVSTVSSPVLFRYGNAPLVVVMPMFVQWGDSGEPASAEPRAEEKDPSGEEQAQQAEEAGEHVAEAPVEEA